MPFLVAIKLPIIKETVMLELCKQCAESAKQAYGYTGVSDFKGLTSKEDQAAGKFAVVECTECGVIQVDSDGACISDDCPVHGKS